MERDAPGQLPDDPWLGTAVGDGYVLLERHAGGTVGEIYLARDPHQELLRAVKVISPNRASGSQTPARFRREARVLASLHHPGIVQVVVFDQLDDGGYYLVMEFVDGPNLQDRVTAGGPLSVPEAVHVLIQLADVLAYAHGQGVVHRDLKPANLLLVGGDPRQLKVVDFGLVKLVGSDTVTRLTEDNQILGTPQYMSPEQCESREAGPAADLYALAGLGYFLISGQSLYNIRSVMGTLLAHAHHTPERLVERCPELGIPAALDRLLWECLAKVPEARPTAAEVAARLRALEATLGPTPQRPAPPQPLPPDEAVRVHRLAREIWAPHPEPGSVDTAEGQRLFRRAALANQIAAALLEGAAALSATPESPRSIREQLDQIARVEARLEAAELELALGGDTPAGATRLGVAPGPDPIRLRARLQEEHRALFRYVMAIQEPSLRPPLSELYARVREFEQTAGPGSGTVARG